MDYLKPTFFIDTIKQKTILEEETKNAKKIRLIEVRKQEIEISKQKIKENKEKQIKQNEEKILQEKFNDYLNKIEMIEKLNNLKIEHLNEIGKSHNIAARLEEEKLLNSIKFKEKQAETEKILKIREQEAKEWLQKEIALSKEEREEIIRRKKEILAFESKIAHEKANKFRENTKNKIEPEEDSFFILNNEKNCGKTKKNLDYTRTHFHNPVIQKHNYDDQKENAIDNANLEIEKSNEFNQSKLKTSNLFLNKSKDRGKIALEKESKIKKLNIFNEEINKLERLENLEQIKKDIQRKFPETNKTVKIYKEKINDEKKLEQEFDKMFSNKPINKKPDPKNFLKRKTSKTPIPQRKKISNKNTQNISLISSKSNNKLEKSISQKSFSKKKNDSFEIQIENQKDSELSDHEINEKSLKQIEISPEKNKILIIDQETKNLSSSKINKSHSQNSQNFDEESNKKSSNEKFNSSNKNSRNLYSDEKDKISSEEYYNEFSQNSNEKIQKLNPQIRNSFLQSDLHEYIQNQESYLEKLEKDRELLKLKLHHVPNPFNEKIEYIENLQKKENLYNNNDYNNSIYENKIDLGTKANKLVEKFLGMHQDIISSPSNTKSPSNKTKSPLSKKFNENYKIQQIESQPPKPLIIKEREELNKNYEFSNESDLKHNLSDLSYSVSQLSPDKNKINDEETVNFSEFKSLKFKKSFEGNMDSLIASPDNLTNFSKSKSPTSLKSDKIKNLHENYDINNNNNEKDNILTINNGEQSLADLFKKKRADLLKKMEKKKEEIKEIKHETKQRTKEEILKLRKEMMKRPENLKEKETKKSEEKNIINNIIEEKSNTNPKEELMKRLALGLRTKVSQKEMKNLTNKNFQQLPEIKKKKEEEFKKNEYKKRQETAKMLDQRIRENLLRK